MRSESGETEYELERIKDKAFKLDRQLADTIIKLNNAQKTINQNNNNGTSVANNHVNNYCDQNGHIVLQNNFNVNNSNNSTSNANSNSSNNMRLNDKTANLTEKQVREIEIETNSNYNSINNLFVYLKKLHDMEFDLEQQRDIANNRLNELEKLNSEYQAALRQIEKLKADVS
jgi:Tfp pilus tip-associated adhesin PilY1